MVNTAETGNVIGTRTCSGPNAVGDSCANTASTNTPSGNFVTSGTLAAELVTDRFQWEREDTYAGRSIVVGTDAYGLTAPRGITARQTVISVADASKIDVGDYLAVGVEMM